MPKKGIKSIHVNILYANKATYSRVKYMHLGPINECIVHYNNMSLLICTRPVLRILQNLFHGPISDDFCNVNKTLHYWYYALAIRTSNQPIPNQPDGWMDG